MPPIHALTAIAESVVSMAQANVPTHEQLIPWIISSLFAIVMAFGGWLLKSLIPAIKELRDEMIKMKEEHKAGHSALTQALLVLTFKVNNPTSDVSNEVSKIAYPADEKK